MSDTDSFIEEVSEEVRRDRLFGLMKRYGWIAIVAVLALVGGAAWNEWNKAQARAKAQSAGDAILAALEADEPGARITALQSVQDQDITQGAKAVVALLQAAEQGSDNDPAGAQAALEKIASDGSLPEIYRQIASFKAASRSDGALSAEERQIRFEALSAPGMALRLLALEQMALLDIDAGDTEAALEKLQGIVVDAEVTAGLRQRATQLIIALGAEPETLVGQN
ncbi:MAG: tetratricopeptide repeat protein [Planktotalea sp.]|uniref:tetratricopeptide repeat protein n=1 Tax=Planktotalea sp. TaxID=2029877 RepID=UPI003C72334B